MSDNNHTTDWLKLTPDAEHIDPYAGLVDFSQDKLKDIRYGFKIVGLNYLIDPEIPAEIITNYTIYPIPKTPAWIKGLINHRGNLIPIFDLYKFFNKEKPENNLPLILFDSNEHMIGIYTDSYPVALESNELQESMYTSNELFPDIIKSYISKSYSIANNDWHNLDLRSFLKHLTRDYSKDQNESPV